MKNEKELWIEKLMSEVTDALPAMNSKNAVLDKILDKIDRPEIQNNIVSFNQFRLAGVAAIAILALNITVIAFSNTQRAQKDNSKTAYGLSTYNLDLYQ